MKSVLISIQPQWCKLIASGKKTVEVRKTRPKIETPFKVYIYCTNPKGYAFFVDKNYGRYTVSHLGNSKVIGEFVCDQIDEIGYSPEMHGKYISDIDDIHYVSCLDFEQMFGYLADGYGYAWHITDLVIYDEPKELSEFKRVCDGNCQTCQYAIWQTSGWAYEPYIVDCKPITRPFQSWGYVEGSKQ